MSKTNSNLVDLLIPAPGYLLIKSEEQETKTSSGIYLPDNAKTEKPHKGTVLAIGENFRDLTSPAQKGDMVFYKKWGGNEVKIENIEYLFVKFEDILATIKK